jgi:hypothetical protein
MHLRIGFILEKSALQTTDKLQRSFFFLLGGHGQGFGDGRITSFTTRLGLKEESR